MCIFQKQLLRNIVYHISNIMPDFAFYSAIFFSGNIKNTEIVFA